MFKFSKCNPSEKYYVSLWKKITYESISIIHSEYKQKSGVPIQVILNKKSEGWIEIFPKYFDGLQDLGEFSHIILIYQFHQSNGYKLLVKPFLNDKERGVFATRAPKRPNPIGYSIVKLDRITDDKLFISQVDTLDGTPLLDIKPYILKFDNRSNVKNGWIDNKIKNKEKHISDERFD